MFRYFISLVIISRSDENVLTTKKAVTMQEAIFCCLENIKIESKPYVVGSAWNSSKADSVQETFGF